MASSSQTSSLSLPLAVRTQEEKYGILLWFRKDYVTKAKQQSTYIIPISPKKNVHVVWQTHILILET